jgi:transposase
MAEQAVLLEIGTGEESRAERAGVPTGGGGELAAKPKLKAIDRSQGLLRPVIVEELVGPDHKVRAIWDLTGQLDLSGFLQKIRSRQGQAGREAWDPRLLLSIWLYAYSEQVTSAREVERLMEYEPGLMWLAGMGEVNHHTLSDFRVEHQAGLKQLLAELLGLLSKEGFVKLELVAHDGTKIRAQAGADSLRREGTLEKKIAEARQMVEELERQRSAEPEGEHKPEARRQAARQRAAREREERLALAAEELKKIRAGKEKESERQEARVSLSEPEARVMKHGDGALAPSYNVQISTDVENNIVVGMHVTQCSSDSGSLDAAMDEVKETAGRYPQRVVTDGGFTNQASIEKMQGKEIDYYGFLPEVEALSAAAMKRAGIDPAFGPGAFTRDEANQTLQCPAGHTLKYVSTSKKESGEYRQYRIQAGECGTCEFQKRCCPRDAERGRMVSIRVTAKAEAQQFREKMKTPEARQIYKQRGAAAEFPNCWIKEKLGIRKFRLSGWAKATTEALWGVLTYDVLQWARLSWRPKLAAAQSIA